MKPRALRTVQLGKRALPNNLLGLQPFAVEARYRDGDFPLPGERLAILEGIQQLMVACQAAIDASKEIRK